MGNKWNLLEMHTIMTKSIKNRIKKTILISLIILIVFGLLNVVSYDNQLASDGLLEVGFPFVFYREFNGKCFDCQVSEGMFYWKLTANLCIPIFLITITNMLIKRKQ